MPRTAEFSEFSFGFALTHSLIKAFGSLLPAAPVFPSLIQEGSKGGGYDVKLPLIPIPLFLQFKIPYVLRRSSKWRPKPYWLPYYRVALRTSAPDQHMLLLTLKKKEPLVFYAMPFFHEVLDLDKHFSSSSVHLNSAFVLPSRLGQLDDGSHHLAYQRGAAAFWLRSEPKAIEGAFDFEHMATALKARREVVRTELHLSGRQPNEDEVGNHRHQTLERLAEVLRTTMISDGRRPAAAADFLFGGDLSERARRIAYAAQVHLGATVALVEAADIPNNDASTIRA